MSATGLRSLDQSLQKTREWVHDVQQELHFDNEEDAYASARAVLHVVRNRLPIQEAVDLGAQLPLILRGAYYDGWKPNDVPVKIRQEQEFYDEVQKELVGREDLNPRRITQGVIKTLKRHISGGEYSDVQNSFPDSLKGMFQVSV